MRKKLISIFFVGVLFATVYCSSVWVKGANEDWQYPLSNTYVCGNDWSEYYSGYASEGRTDHCAIDIASRTGDTAIYAAANGTVRKTGKNGANGDYVVLQHTLSGKTVYSFYAHLSAISVTDGIAVSKGEKIGVIGNSGSGSKGIHLHFAIADTYKQGSYYGYVQAFNGDQVKCAQTGVTFYNPHYIISNNTLPGEVSSSGVSPSGVIDVAEGGMQSVRISGWAVDQDDVSQPVEIRVYIGETLVGATLANQYRPDLNTNAAWQGVGDYHGFDTTISVNADFVGNQTLSIFAIDIGGSQHTLIGTPTVIISADTEIPIISNAQIIDISPTGYTVSCTASDNIGIKEVSVATWTSAGGQDDLKWQPATVVSGDTYSCRVQVSDHNNEAGNYITHIYAYDINGNQHSCGVGATVPQADYNNVAAELGGNFYAYIENVDAGTVLTIKKDNSAMFTAYSRDNTQLWHFTLNENGSYRISPKSDETRALHVVAASGISGASVIVHTQSQVPAAQQWFVSEIDGKYYFRPACAADCYLDLPFVNHQNGVSAQIYTFNTGGAQGFNIKKLGGEDVPVAEGVFNNRTYQVYDYNLTWTEAKIFCENLGGNLVSITSQEEQDFVADLIDGKGKMHQYWIGGRVMNDGFAWSDGEVWSYTNWDSGEPNAAEKNGETEGYAQIYNIKNPKVSRSQRFKWNDAFENNQFEGEEDFFGLHHVGFICEINRTEAPEISDVKITNISGKGYTVTCTVISDSEITRVQFPTWLADVGKESLPAGWENDTAFSGTGSGTTYTYRVEASDFNDDRGPYCTEICAYDSEGNVASADCSVVTLPESIVYGDVDDDGKVNLKDVTLLRRYLSDAWGTEEIQAKQSDVDKDGQVTLKDLTVLRRYLAGGWGIDLNPGTDVDTGLAGYPVLSTEKNESGIATSSISYGKSQLGRELVCWSIQPEHYTRTVLLNFAIHGWEDSYAADGELLAELGDALVEYYGESEDLKNCRLLIIPRSNPDGLAAGTTNNGFGRCNAVGIDLNRDFDADHVIYTNARNYTEYPFSAVESRALRDLVYAASPDVVVDFHGWLNYTIGDADLAEVFSLEVGLDHKNEFAESAHGYFAYWAELQGAEGLLVEFKDTNSIVREDVIAAVDVLISGEYGDRQAEPALDLAYADYSDISAYALTVDKIETYSSIAADGEACGYISGASDLCEIRQIYANGWCKVGYPTVSGLTKTGYCLFSAFVDSETVVPHKQAKVSVTTVVYTTVAGTTKLGSVWTTDSLTVVAEQGGMSQIIYPLDSGGYKMGWVNSSALTTL